jgi:uncharacterized protein YbbC (DUF1343 family)/CubicO group peptidase (beta-lactamase class C family)
LKRATNALLLLLLVSCSTLEQSLDNARLRDVDAAITDAIAEKRIPGGVLWIEHDGETYHRAYGNRALAPEVESNAEDTIYDAASITKVVATAPSIWLLIERGKVGLDTPIRNYIPEYVHPDVTVRHLLTHTAGLPPSVPRDGWLGYDGGIARAASIQPVYRPGAIFRYSDVGYILLGEIVRRASGMPLDRFAETEIFAKLGMRDTGFLPSPVDRIAPTEKVDDAMLRGAVHDPTARQMGGVAGHAGLFTTAADLAKFARTLLDGKFFPAAMTQVQSPRDVAIQRMGGFDVDSSYSKPRGEHFPIGSYGHTGWTGGFLWIDPSSKSFYVFLSNRVHPDGKGNVVALQRRLGTAVARAIRHDWAPAYPRVRYPIGGADAQNGIDVLHATNYEALRGLRIGLITNATALDRAGNPTVDLIRSAPGIQLVALFSPEHGFRVNLDDDLGDEVDRATGLPIYSLYGETRKPKPEQLANLDALVFDVQDIGTRFYTYISTMGLAMEAAAEAKKKFIVLDRVNPIGGVHVEGPVLEGDADFVAWHSIVVRHGMTIGELAKMFNDERNIRADLLVVPVRSWKREQWQDEAGQPWTNTSPNMRSLLGAGLYPGIGLMERAVSVGRGTPTPFEILGAPYIDGEQLIRELGPVPGVAFTPIRFTPNADMFANQECGGVRMEITDRRALHAVDLGIHVASTLARMYGAKFDVDRMQRLLRHKASIEAIRAGKPAAEIKAMWDTEAFLVRRAKYLMY